MGDYLEVTNGKYSNSKMKEWEQEASTNLRSDNNPAERPFAVVKALLHVFPSMTIANLGRLAHARVNGTFRLTSSGGKTKKTAGRSGKKAGAAVTAHPALKAAVSKLCCIRKCSSGLVTLMVRGHVKADAAAELVRREKDKDDLLKKNITRAKERAIKLDIAVNTKLCTLAGMKVTLKGKEGKKGQTLEYLKAQFWARTTGRGWTYTTIPPSFKNATQKKLKLSPPEGGDEVEYLTALLTLMIAVDKKEKRKDTTQAARTALRSYKPISEKFTSQFSTDNKAKLTKLHDELAKQTDDPVLAQLDADYKGKLLCDFEDDLADADPVKLELDPDYKRTHQVLEITHDDKGGSPYFQVDCFEVRMGAKGSWLPVPGHYNQVEDERIFKAGKLWNCKLVCLKDPDNAERLPWVGEHVVAHKNRGVVPACCPAPGASKSRAPKRRRNN